MTLRVNHAYTIPISLLVAILLFSPHAHPEKCSEVHKLTEPCTGRLIPDTLYLELWTTLKFTVPRLEAKLAAEVKLRAAEKATCAARLASCNTEVREIEVIVEKRVSVAMPTPIGEYVLVGGVALVVGVVVGILVGRFAVF
jgi:hypothetical protein